MTRAQNLTWLAAVPAGWRPILSDAIDQLHVIDVTIRIAQAKEKFGSLRIYLDQGSSEAYAIVDAARAASEKACELCRADARLMRTPDGYYSTRCPDHATGFSPVEEPPSVSLRILIEGSGNDPETGGDNDISRDGQWS